MDYYGWQQTPLDFILLGWLLLPIQSFQDLSNFVDKGWGSVWRPCYGCRRTVTMWYSFHWRKRCPDYTYNGISRKLMIFFFFLYPDEWILPCFRWLQPFENLQLVCSQGSITIQFQFSFWENKKKKEKRKNFVSTINFIRNKLFILNHSTFIELGTLVLSFGTSVLDG